MPNSIQSKFDLFPFQTRAVDRFQDRNVFLLHDDTGLGKTRTSFAWAVDHPKRLGRPILVATPASVRLKWKSEVEKVMPGMPVMVMTSQLSIPRRDEALELLEQGGVLICSPEMPTTKNYTDLCLESVCFGSIILDEAHYMKSWLTKRTRAWARFLEIQKWMRHGENVPLAMLTATPITNTPSDLISQLALAGLLNYYNACEWMITRKSNMRSSKPVQWSGDEAKNEVMRILKTHGISRRKAQVLPDLPELRRQSLEVQITYKDVIETYQKIMKEREEKADADTKQIKIDPKFFLEANTRQKIIQRNGEIRFTAGLEPKPLHVAIICNDLYQACGRLKALPVAQYVADTLDCPTLIFTHHVYAGQLIVDALQKLGVSVEFIHGGRKMEDRQAMVADLGKGTSILVATYGAAGLGLDIVQAKRLIIGELTYSPASMKQATDRIHRIGQDKSVLVETAIGTAKVGTDTIDIEKIIMLRAEAKIKNSSSVGLGNMGIVS